jgi:hypothetical protein
MKVFVSVLLVAVINSSFAQTASYDFYNVTPVVGNGIRLWGSDLYKIHFGNTTEYLFGPVIDYSIKMNMSSQSGRGWTWGIAGATPVAALNNQGNMQIAGTFTAGSIGIGILTPSYDIDISRNGAGAGLRIFSPGLTGRSTFVIGQALGGKYGYVAHHSQSYDAGAGYTLTYKPSSTVLVGSDVNGLGIISTSDIRFSSGGDDDAKQKMIINSAGNVGIGTTSPDALLAVKGTIHSKEVKVDLTGAMAGPDYVFEKDYKLPTLEEIKSYIDQNQHLPGVPSAAEMEKSGVKLGEMNILLLKKVEGLTLYLIEQDKSNRI